MPQLPQRTTAPDPDVPGSLVAAELERIRTSEAFRRSPLQFKLLAHLVAESRKGAGHLLTETALAIDVLRHDPRRFDARKHTSVRVTVRRLRQRLARYYAEEGASAAIEIDLPIGSYQPRLRIRRGPSGPRLPSVAVLPFRNFLDEAGRNAYGDHVAGALTDALAQLPGLRIAARSSAFRFRDVDPRVAGSALRVATLIEGGLHGGESGLRATVQWIRVADGSLIWSAGFDALPGETDTEFGFRMARRVVEGLQREIADHGPIRGSTAAPVAPKRSRSDTAQERFHRARYLMRGQTADGYARAIAPLREAVAADPEFALAWSALAHALVNVIGLTLTGPAELLAEARAHLARALAIDPRLGEAHALDGFIACAFDRDWQRAEQAFLRGIHHAPSLCYAHSAFGWGLMVNARYEEADSEYRYARMLEPLDLKIRSHHALVALYRGDDEYALREFASLVEIEPSFLIAAALLATAYLWKGDFAAARRHFETLAARYPSLTIGEVGIAQIEATTGRKTEARARLANLMERTIDGKTVRYLPPYQAAMIHARLGDHVLAVDWLERAADELDMNFVCAPVDRTFIALRDDPRFVGMLERRGLRPVWRLAG